MHSSEKADLRLKNASPRKRLKAHRFTFSVLSLSLSRSLSLSSTMMASPLHDAMQKALWKYGHERIELEWRVGIMQPASGFRPGVNEAAWNRVKNVLDVSDAFTCTYSETRELITPEGKLVLPHNVWMYKKKLASFDTNPESCAWSIRAAIALEETEPHVGHPVVSKYERLKKRWSYRHKCWSFDLTRVRSNLPSDLDNDSDIFEIEIELVDHSVIFERPLDTIIAWGANMARDICAFLLAPAVLSSSSPPCL